MFPVLSEEKAKLLREVMATIDAKNEILEYVCVCFFS